MQTADAEVVIATTEAPHVISAPCDRPHRPSLAPASAIDAALARGARRIRLTGGEPLRHPDLHHHLARITRGGARALVRTRLPGLDDDEPVRPFAPHDVRFEVMLPWAPDHDRDRWEEVAFGLRNLKAFAYPADLLVPVTVDNLDHVAAIVSEVHQTDLARSIHLEVLSPSDASDARWPHAPTWSQVNDVLQGLHDRALSPPPRITVAGVPVLGLAVDRWTGLDLRTNEGSDATADPTDAYLAHHPDPRPDVDTLARRRTWLVTPEREREGYRGDARDRFDDAVSMVLVRPDEAVFTAIENRQKGRPYLATADRFGLGIFGKMRDPTSAARFRALAGLAHAHAKAEPPKGLADLRALAHVLRRSMKPKHDDAPVKLRNEGE